MQGFKLATSTVALAAVSVLVLCPGRVGAAPVPFNQLSQSRTLEARVTVPDLPTPNTSGDIETSNELGSFSRSMDFELTGRGGPIGQPPHARSNPTETVIFTETQEFLGQFIVQGSARHNGPTPSSTLGRTQWQTVFTVDRPWQFVFQRQARIQFHVPAATGQFHVLYSFIGEGPAGETQQIDLFDRAGTTDTDIFDPLVTTGTLLAGWTYRMNAEVSGDIATLQTSPQDPRIDGQVDFSIKVPEPSGLIALGMPALLLRRRRRLV